MARRERPRRGAPTGRKPAPQRRAAPPQRRAQQQPQQRRAPPPPRPQRRTFPTVEPGPAGPPLAREWLFTTRAGAEFDLVEELTFLDAEAGPRRAGEALVAARRVPRAEHRPLELALSRP